MPIVSFFLFLKMGQPFSKKRPFDPGTRNKVVSPAIEGVHIPRKKSWMGSLDGIFVEPH